MAMNVVNCASGTQVAKNNTGVVVDFFRDELRIKLEFIAASHGTQ